MTDLASTINGGAIAMPDPEQMDRRLILKRAHQNSSGSSGSEPDTKNLRKRLNVGESGDSVRSMTSGTTTENDVFHKYVGPPQSAGGATYDVMDDLAKRIEPVHRPIEVFEKLDDSLFDGAGPFGDFEGTDEDDGFLHDDRLMMWDDGDDLVAPADANAAAAAAVAARDEVTQLVAGLDDGRKEALKSLLARSAHGAAPDSLHHDVRSILSTSLSYSTDSFAAGGGAGRHLHVLIDDPVHAFDPSTLQYLREAMLSDGDGGGGGGGLEPMSISSKSDRSDAPTKRSNGRAKANRTPTTTTATTTEESSTPTSQSSSSTSRRKTAAQKRKEEQEKEKAAAGLLRGNYRCGRCGLPKVNHVCQFVDTVGSHVAVQVEAPILDVVTGLPFEGERFLSISAANSPAPSHSSHKSMAVVSPRSATVATGDSGRYATAAGAYDSMDVDDASSTVSFGVPAPVGSPLWVHPPPPQSRVLQGQLAMSLDGYEYVDHHLQQQQQQQQYAAMAPAVQNPMLMGQFYHPQPQPDPSSFGAGPFYPPPPMQDPTGGPFCPPQDDAAYEQSAYDAFHPDRQHYQQQQQQQQQQQNADGSQQQQQQQSSRTNGYGFVCTVNDQTDFACFPFFCF